MDAEQRLARYQAELLQALSEGVDAEQLAQRLRPLGKEYWETLDGLEPAAVETAVELVETWAVRSSADE